MQTSPSDTYLTPYKAEITLKKCYNHQLLWISRGSCNQMSMILSCWSLPAKKNKQVSPKNFQENTEKFAYPHYDLITLSRGKWTLSCWGASSLPHPLFSQSPPFPSTSLSSPLLSSPLLSLFPSLALLSGQVFSSIPKRSHTICLHPEFPFRSSEAPPCP